MPTLAVQIQVWYRIWLFFVYILILCSFCMKYLLIDNQKDNSILVNYNWRDFIYPWIRDGFSCDDDILGYEMKAYINKDSTIRFLVSSCLLQIS